jgi:DNA-binding beta-propeller fold protein YncE
MRRTLPRSLGLMLVSLGGMFAAAQLSSQSFIGNLNTITTLTSTIPANGDVNPYGVALVPHTAGKLVEGQFLVSNFNNSANQQGTGTTIVEISPGGSLSLFAQINPATTNCPGGVGLTTALVALESDYVIVGSLPTSLTTGAISGAGCLIVLNSDGKVVETFTGHHINGPWDMTAVDVGPVAALFVTNVLDGTVAANGKVVKNGTVVRMVLSIPEGHAPQLVDSDVVATGFPQRTDPTALVIGPTGVAYDDFTGNLYVADTLDNRIAAIPFALFRESADDFGSTVSEGSALNGPLGLVLAPNHHLLAANGGDGNLVEVDPFTRKQVATKLLDDTPPPPLGGAGALFGLAATKDGVYFVDDDSNTFNLLD